MFDSKPLSLDDLPELSACQRAIVAWGERIEGYKFFQFEQLFRSKIAKLAYKLKRNELFRNGLSNKPAAI